jgi:hypothetical protein
VQLGHQKGPKLHQIKQSGAFKLFSYGKRNQGLSKMPGAFTRRVLYR